METCVKAWDAYHESGVGFLELKQFWAREKYQQRYGISSSIFYKYARADKSKRTPLYSQAGPAPLPGHANYSLAAAANVNGGDASGHNSNTHDGDECETTVTGESDNDEEENGYCYGKRQINQYLYELGRTMEQLTTATDRRHKHKDPILVEFELWHLHNCCTQMDYWLTYYGYGHASVAGKLRGLMSLLAEKLDPTFRAPVGDENELAHELRLPRLDPMRSFPNMADLKMMEHEMEMTMTGGGWH